MFSYFLFLTIVSILGDGSTFESRSVICEYKTAVECQEMLEVVLEGFKEAYTEPEEQNYKFTCEPRGGKPI